MTSREKVKGSKAEREFAKVIGEALGVENVSRNLEQSRGGGYDLKGLEDLGLAVEVKRQEKLQLNAWWTQAVQQTNGTKLIPVLAYRQNRKPWVIRIDLSDFNLTTGPVLVDTSVFGFTTIYGESFGVIVQRLGLS